MGNKRNWINENIGALIAFGFLFFAFYTFRMVLLKEVKSSDTVTISIIECVKGGVFLLLGYYYGSSSGSRSKQELIERKMGTQAPGVDASQANITINEPQSGN